MTRDDLEDLLHQAGQRNFLSFSEVDQRPVDAEPHRTPLALGDQIPSVLSPPDVGAPQLDQLDAGVQAMRLAHPVAGRVGGPVVDEDDLEAAAQAVQHGRLMGRLERVLADSFAELATEADAALRAMLEGATRTFFDPGRTYEDVADLVPVKPLADAEPQIRVAWPTVARGHAEPLRRYAADETLTPAAPNRPAAT